MVKIITCQAEKAFDDELTAIVDASTGPRNKEFVDSFQTLQFCGLQHDERYSGIDHNGMATFRIQMNGSRFLDPLVNFQTCDSINANTWLVWSGSRSMNQYGVTSRCAIRLTC
jgi:hypothetical protein